MNLDHLSTRELALYIKCARKPPRLPSQACSLLIEGNTAEHDSKTHPLMHTTTLETYHHIGGLKGLRLLKATMHEKKQDAAKARNEWTGEM
jgi:hypothetical protein